MGPYIHDSNLFRGVRIEEKILAALRFFACGSYQRSIGEEYNSNLSQYSVHRYIHQVTEAIVLEFANEYIVFPSSIQERNELKEKFMQKYNFPGIIGCVDCTHVAILKPKVDEQNFINRKGYHSLNVQLICDPDLKILNVNANYGGSTHDSFIFRHSGINNYLANLHGETFWLLGDSGYPQLPYLMTPVRNAVPHTPEWLYNEAHIATRNCIERCNGVLKGRFRCLLKERTARYEPRFVAELVKACSILHNMCVAANIPIDVNIPADDNENQHNENFPLNVNNGFEQRQQLINTYFT